MTAVDDETPEEQVAAPPAPRPHRRRVRRPLAQRRRARTGRRSLSERITVSMLAGAIAALLAFVLVFAVLRDRREMVEVAVPSERIAPGTEITGAMVRMVEVPSSVSFSGSLLGDLADGAVALRTLEPGEPIPASAVGEAGSTRVGRVISVPVEDWAAVGGELEAGDQVDVIDTGGDRARYVVSNAMVVGRSTGERSGGLGSVGRDGFWITIEVTAEEALEVARVVTADEFMLVRSTGAPRTDIEPAGAESGD